MEEISIGINVANPDMVAPVVKVTDRTSSCFSTAEKSLVTTQLKQSTPPSKENGNDGMLHIR